MSNTFFISDTHFDHNNIIKYCNRPFTSATKMNEVLLKNWEDAIKPEDDVYFLGDLTMKNTRVWLDKLTGKIHFIRGNHDRKKGYEFKNIDFMDIGPYHCALIHDPWGPLLDGVDVDFIIHGHIHSNLGVYFPPKYINMSVEVTDYKPVSIAEMILIMNERKLDET